MARFLIATLPITGHVYPGIPIARALVAAGHDVLWYTGKKFRPKVEAVGARFAPMKDAYDFDDLKIDECFPDRTKHQALAQLKFDLRNVFIDSAPGQLSDLEAILKDFPADVMVNDTAFVAVPLVSERHSIPYGTYGVTALTINSRDTAPFGLGILPNNSALGRVRNGAIAWAVDNLVFGGITSYYNSVRAKLGFPRYPGGNFLNSSLGPYLYLQPTVPSFEYPRSDLPKQVHFIGPFLPETSPDFVPPKWWDELKSDKRVVYVTQGTAATNSDLLIVPTIKALADEDVLVVVTTGGKPANTVKLDSLPANVRIEAFIPHAHLMPHVDVMVTNGGYGGVHHALSFGIPIVAAGTTEDKPEIANRVSWSGAGMNLRATSPKPEQVKAAVRSLLGDSTYREGVRRLQTEIGRYDAPSRAVALLTKLAETKQPVLASPAEVASA
jgi:UDP:flavonoid glycosyltransferase YjiC (YdhE family)